VSALLLCLVSAVYLAHAAGVSEYQIKAAFLFNFLQFVDWPHSAFRDERDSLVMCILGPDPFGPELDSIIAGERIKGRPIIAQRYDHIDALGRCHLVFVNKSSRNELRNSLARLKGQPVLTVGETEAFTGLGGMIEFVTQNNRIRLRVNVDAANEAQLRLSSKLLRRSEIVAPVKV
jgi:hypothetical protein